MEKSIKKLGKNTVLVFIGNFGSKAISFLLLPFYTAWMSVDDYGLSDIISVYASLLIGVVTCCISEALFVFPKGQCKSDQEKYFSSSLLFVSFTLTVVGIIFYLIHLIGCTYSLTGSFVNNIALIYLMLISQVLQQLFQQFVRSIDKMVVFSATGIVTTIGMAIFAFIMIPGYGIKGYVWSIILANLTAALFSFIASKSYLYFNVNSFDRTKLRSMLKYSLPLIPNGIMWWLVSSINRPILEKCVGLHDIGLYAVANKFPSILTMTFSVFVTAWQISVLEEFGKDSYKSFYNKIFRAVFLLLYIVTLLISILSKSIITVFVDEAYYEAWHFIPMLTLGVLFSNIAGFVGTNFSATKESKYYFYSSIAAAVVAVALNFVLIPLFGIWGAVYSVLFSFIVMAVSRIIFGWKYVEITDVMSYIVYLILVSIFIILYSNSAPVITKWALFIIICGYLYLAEKNRLVEAKSLLMQKIKRKHN